MLFSAKKGLASAVFFIALLILLGLVVGKRKQYAPEFLLVHEQAEPIGLAINQGARRPVFRKDFVCSPCEVARVHAATLAVTAPGTLHTFWWGGTKEAYADVSLYSSQTNATHKWSPPRHRLNVGELSAALGRYTKLIGNPAAVVDLDGRIWLFFVSVSAGGWSGSSINFMRSADNGKTWSRPKKLITSPFFNVSTAVRSKPVLFSDGSIGVPVYHELAGIFSELLKVDQDGRVMGKYRITWGQHTLQPSLIIESPFRALALHRQRGTAQRKIMSNRTSSGGMHWSAIQPIDLPNPDASVAALKAHDGKYILAFNNRKNDRKNLALAVSIDKGNSWRVIGNVEDSQGNDDEFSYPTIVQAADGMFHMVYTWKRKGIAHVQFNPAWVNRKLAQASREDGSGK